MRLGGLRAVKEIFHPRGRYPRELRPTENGDGPMFVLWRAQRRLRLRSGLETTRYVSRRSATTSTAGSSWPGATTKRSTGFTTRSYSPSGSSIAVAHSASSHSHTNGTGSSSGTWPASSIAARRSLWALNASSFFSARSRRVLPFEDMSFSFPRAPSRNRVPARQFRRGLRRRKFDLGGHTPRDSQLAARTTPLCIAGGSRAEPVERLSVEHGADRAGSGPVFWGLEVELSGLRSGFDRVTAWVAVGVTDNLIQLSGEVIVRQTSLEDIDSRLARLSDRIHQPRSPPPPIAASSHCPRPDHGRTRANDTCSGDDTTIGGGARVASGVTCASGWAGAGGAILN